MKFYLRLGLIITVLLKSGRITSPLDNVMEVTVYIEFSHALPTFSIETSTKIDFETTKILENKNVNSRFEGQDYCFF